MELFSAEFFSALCAIIIIDLALAGDNAIVIALAARDLPANLQRRAIVWGTFGAIAVRVVMTMAVVWLLGIPGLMAAGGAILVWIAYKLLKPQGGEGGHEVKAAATFCAKLKGEPTVIPLQNGIENQPVLPKYFARVVYGVMRYNAWRDAANEFGYERRGPILLGVIDPTLVGDRDRAVQLFSTACECRAEERIADAAQCKMVLNLTNSISALVGFGLREIEDYKAFSQSVSRVMYEGMQILRSAGVQEVSMGDGATWRTMTLARYMPSFVKARVLKKGMRDMHITSMGQDVYLTKRGATELESLNGYFLWLPEKVRVDARYNRAQYSITKEWLAQPEIRPMHERELWAKLRQA